MFRAVCCLFSEVVAFLATAQLVDSSFTYHGVGASSSIGLGLGLGSGFVNRE